MSTKIVSLLKKVLNGYKKRMASGLFFHHGVDRRDSQYRLGAMLLALDDPQRIIARSRFPVLEPQLPFECSGVVRNVVFPCGSALREQTVYIYYGAADFVLGVASFDVKELLSYLKVKESLPVHASA